MAMILQPQMRRSVNVNPQGSATAVVTMPANNPFERQITSVRPGNQFLPGVGSLWDDIKQAVVPATSQTIQEAAASTTAPAQGGGFFSTLLSNTANAAITATTQNLLGTKPQPVASAGAVSVPSAGGISAVPSVLPVLPAPAPKSKLPWILGGLAVAGVAVVVILKMRKKA